MERMPGITTKFETVLNAVDTSLALPLELWCMVIDRLHGQSLAELAFLWLTVRNVSKQFRAEVEKVFAQQYLGKSTLLGHRGYLHDRLDTYHFNQKRFVGITFGETSSSYDSAAATERLGTVPFEFSHIDQIDPNRAVFVISKQEQQAVREMWYFMGYKSEDPFMDKVKQLPTRLTQSHFGLADEEIVKKDIFIAQIRGPDDGSESHRLNL